MPIGPRCPCSVGHWRWPLPARSARRYDGGELIPQEAASANGRPNTGIWGRSANDVVISRDSTPLFFDGTSWSLVLGFPLGGGSFEQFAVSGFGADDLYFGQIGQIVHMYRPTETFTTYAVSGRANDLWVSPSHTVYALTGDGISVLDGVLQPAIPIPESSLARIGTLWGTSDQNLWLAGSRILQYDGTGFTVHDRPDQLSSSHIPNALNDIWGAAANEDIFAVGERGTILHYDGSAWRRQAGPDLMMDVPAAGAWTSIHGTRPDDLVAGTTKDVFQRVGERWEHVERFSMEGRVYDVWGASPNEAWAVGWKIWRWDGNPEGDWEEFESPVSVDLNRVHGTAPNDFYIAADDATLLHYDGSTFEVVSLPNIGVLDLNDVWAAAPDRVFVAVHDQTILLFNGMSWGVHDLTGLGLFGRVTALWGEVVDEIISVYAATDQGELLEWEGGANWSVIDTGLPSASRTYLGLWGVRGPETFDLFAVGRTGGTGGHALITHMHNGTFSEYEVPSADFLTDVHGLSRTEVFASNGQGPVEMLRFDGVEWTLLPPPGREINSQPRGLGAAGDSIIAGGQDFFLYYDGEWRVMARDMSDYQSFSDVQRAPSGDVFAVGDSNLYHYNGMTWQLTHDWDMTRGDYCGRFWTDGTEFFLLCSRGADAVHHFDGTTWQPMDFPDQRVSDIWGTSADDVYVVGPAGAIAHYDGNPTGRWDAMASGIDTDLNAVSGFGPDDIFAGGEDEVILHYDGVSWTPMTTPVALFQYYPIKSLFADPDSRIAFAGMTGHRTMAYRNGVWNYVDTLKTRGAVDGVWTNGAQVFFATSTGEILRGDIEVVFESGFEPPPQVMR